MTFSWLNFCRAHHIEYVERGPNVSRGNINIRCPLCGNADPSEHMGLSLVGTEWGCRRNDYHRGIKAQRLILKLIRCSWEQANKLVEGERSVTPIGVLMERFKQINEKNKVKRPEVFEFPEEFRDIVDAGLPKLYYQYIARRGFTNVAKVVDYYGLKCATDGRFANRVIMPFYKYGKLYGWTGRAIGKRAEIRYDSYPHSDQVKTLVYNHDAMLEGGRVCVVVEGPFDAVKLDWYGYRYGVRAVGVLGNAAEEEQLAAIIACADNFDEWWVILDSDAKHKALGLSRQLSILQPKIKMLREGVKDPGALRKEQIVELCC